MCAMTLKDFRVLDSASEYSMEDPPPVTDLVIDNTATNTQEAIDWNSGNVAITNTGNGVKLSVLESAATGSIYCSYPNGNVSVTNNTGAEIDFAGMIHNTGTGVVELNNHGTFTIGTTTHDNMEVSVSNADAGNVVISNDATMTIEGAVVNSGSGSILISNNLTGNLAINGQIRNVSSGAITVTNSLTGTLNIGGNVTNLGKGTVTLENCTSVDGYVYGERVIITGATVFHGVVGNITALDTASTVNHLTITDSTVGEELTAALIAGAAGLAAGDFVGSTNVEIAGNSTIYSDIYGGALDKNVAGNTEVVIKDSSSITGDVYGGSRTGVVFGSTAVTILGDTDITGDIYGRGNASVSSDTLRGTSTVTLGDGSFEPPVVLMATPMLAGTINVITIVGNVYGGGNNSSVNSSIVVNVAGTVATNVKLTGKLFGGCNNGDVFGDVTINISGTKLTDTTNTSWITDNVYGGSYTGDIGKSSSLQTVYINVNGGRLDGNIYVAGDRATGSKGNLYGNAEVTFKGTGANLQFNRTVFASGANGGQVLGTNSKTTFKFDGFSGNFNATVNGFTEMQFLNQATVTLALNSQLVNISKYTFNFGSSTPLTPSLTITDNSGVNLPSINNVSVVLALGQLQNNEYVLVQGSQALMDSFSGDSIQIFNPGSSTATDYVVVNGAKYMDQGSTRIYAYTNELNQLIIGCEPKSSVTLQWPTDFWSRNAPQRAVAYTGTSSVSLYDTADYKYQDSLGANSTKALITGDAAGTVYGGSSSAVTTGSTWINVNASSTVSAGLTIYGGGKDTAVTGNANVYIYKGGTNAPKINALYGGGFSSAATKSSSVANSYITIAGANFGSLTTTAIYGGGNASVLNSTSSVTGSTNVTFSGLGSDLNFFGTAYGSGTGAGTSTVTGQKNLFFGDSLNPDPGTVRNFSGNFNGNFNNFDTMTVRAGSQVTLAQSANTFRANTWQINGSLTTGVSGVFATAKNLTDIGSIAINTASTGTITDQIHSNVNQVITNAGTMNGARFATGTIQLANTGTMNGELFARSLAINNSTGLLNTVTMNADAGNLTSLTIANASTQSNVLQNNTTLNYATATNWLVNSGTLTLQNLAGKSLTIGNVLGTAAVNNNGGTLALENFGTWNYTGAINGNATYNSVPVTTAGQMTLLNHSAGQMTMTGVANATYNRNVLIVSQNPIAGSSLTITNGLSSETVTGTMRLNGAVYALSTVALTITNRGNMYLGDNTVGAANLRAMLNSSGPGGVLLDNYNYIEVDGIRNEWASVGATSGDMQLNNHAGTFKAHARLFDGTEVLPLNTVDWDFLKTILTGQLVSATNIGSNGSLKVTNALNATFASEGMALNAMGASLELNNTGSMSFGSLYDSLGIPSATGTKYKDSLVNYKTTNGVTVTNTGTLNFNGAVTNFETGSISLANTSAAATMTINGNNFNGYALFNTSSGNITVTNTAGTLNIYGNIENRNSGSISISNYTKIVGNVIGKNISLSGPGQLTGDITGGDINTGETSTVAITGGTIGQSGNIIAGATGSTTPGATVVTITGTTTVNSRVYGGGNNVEVTGQSSVTVGGTGSTVQLNDHLFGAGNGSNVGSVQLTLSSGVTCGTGANVYGGGNGAHVTGNVNLNVTAGTYNTVFGGSLDGNAGSVTGTISGISAGSVYGGGASVSSEVLGDIQLSVAHTRISGTLFGGGWSNVRGSITLQLGLDHLDTSVYSNNVYGGICVTLPVATAFSGGAVNFTINGGTFNGVVAGGSRVVVYESSKTVTHTNGKVTMLVSGGTFSASQAVFAGGFATCEAAMTTIGALSLRTAGVELNWTGGVHANVTASSGRGVFLGAVSTRRTSTEVVGAHATISGGKISYLYGGGYADNGGIAKVVSEVAAPYAVEITIAGNAEVGTVYGGGYIASSGGTSIIEGNVLITIKSFAALGTVFAGGRSGCMVNGNSTVSLQGANDFNFNVNGAYVRDTKWLDFDAYTGTFSGSITNFNAISTSNSAAAKCSNAANNLAGIGKWEFDLSGSDVGSALAAFDLLAGTNNFAQDTVKLVVDDQNAVNGSTWQIYAGSTNGIDLADVTLWNTSNQQLNFGTASGDWKWEHDSSKVWLTKLA